MSDQPSNPSNRDRHEEKFALPKPRPAEPRPILEQVHAEWVRLAQKDRRLGDILRFRREAQFTVKKNDAAYRLRMKFLQRKAVEKIQQRNGIRVIPGFRLPGSAAKEDIDRMVDQLRVLASRHGFNLPADFQVEQKQIEGPTDAPPTEHR